MTGRVAPAPVDAGFAVVTTGAGAPVRVTVLMPPQPDGPLEVVIGIPDPDQVAAIRLTPVVVSRAFTLEVRRSDGTPVRTHPRPLTIAVAYVDADLAVAGGDPAILRLLRWHPERHAARVLDTVVDRNSKTLTTQTDETSLFLIGAVPPGAPREVPALASAPWGVAPAPTPVLPNRMPRVGAAGADGPAAATFVVPAALATAALAVLASALRRRRPSATPERPPPPIGAAVRRRRRVLLLGVPLLLCLLALEPHARLVAATLAALPRAAMLVGGFDGRRAFLLIGQNADEPRPTGGFMGSFGLLTIERGRLTGLDYRNSREFEDPNAPSVLPPPPFERYAGLGVWQMRDANWSPDFPTTMEQLAWFWRRDQGQVIDGALAFTEEALVRLLAVLGPVTLGETGEVVGAENAREWILRELYPLRPDGRPSYDPEGKTRTLAPLARLLLERLTRPAPGEVVPLARTTVGLLREKHLLVWFRDPALQRLVAAWGLGGAIRPSSGDYLALVDTSVSYTKMGRYLLSGLAYEVEPLPSERVLRSRLTVTYENRYNPTDARRLYPPFYLTRLYDPGRDTFVDAEGYWATWMRAFVPAGAVYRGASGLDEPPAVDEEAGKTVIGAYVVLGPGERRRIMLEYDSPDTAPAGEYRLLLQRQPGIDREYAVRVRTESGGRVAEARWHGDLVTDVVLSTRIGR